MWILSTLTKCFYYEKNRKSNRLGCMKLRNKFFTLVLLTIIGCAPSPQGVYDSIESVESNNVATKLSEAVKFNKAEEISPNDIIDFELGKGNPMIELANDHQYRSFYRLFEFKGSAGSKVSFKITTSCKCISVFRETIVYPVAYILEDNGNVLASYPKEWVRKHDFILTGLSYEGIWQAKIPEDGKYVLLVAADNSFVGLVLGIIYPLIFPDSPETYILSSPSGKVTVEMLAN
jgi:hypothetical protein